MERFQVILRVTLLGVAIAVADSATAAVTAEEAAKLKSDLTPFGAERAGNKDGSIPAWTGGYTTPIPGDRPGGRRGDPFKDEKPLFSIDSKNANRYADCHAHRCASSHANSVPDANGHQFRSVGWRGRDQSRQ